MVRFVWMWYKTREMRIMGLIWCSGITYCEYSKAVLMRGQQGLVKNIKNRSHCEEMRAVMGNKHVNLTWNTFELTRFHYHPCWPIFIPMTHHWGVFEKCGKKTILKSKLKSWAKLSNCRVKIVNMRYYVVI